MRASAATKEPCSSARGETFRVWSVAALLLPCFAFASGDQTPVPMRDVALRGQARSAPNGGGVELVIQSTIRTPLGRIPINSYLELHYDCTSAFTGKMSYSPIVRLFAKIKGVDLIRRVDGKVDVNHGDACPSMVVQRIHGKATVEATQLAGHLNLDADSLSFRGPAWMTGDTSYHSVLSATRGDRAIQLTVNMYER